MARVPYVDTSPQFPDYDGTKHRNITRALMNSPVLAKRMLAANEYMRTESRLDKRLRELVIVKIGCLTKSTYDYVSHVRAALALGVTDEEIRAVAADHASSIFDDKTASVLDCVRELIETDTLSDALFDRVAIHLEPDQIVDLFVTISNYRGIEMLGNALGLELEPQYQEILERFPLSE
jgi:alkylhydroperoxidase family enzyme